MTNWTPSFAEGTPRYLAIADSIAADLAAGKLKPGDRLPPQRDLAWQLGVTIGTVTRAYQEASKRGLLSGEVGRGSYLREPSASLAAIQALSRGIEPGVLNMQISAPPRVHQASDLDAALAEIARDPNWRDLLDYGPAAGLPQHRAAGARWLAKAEVDVAPDDIVLSAGAQAALVSCFATLSSPGETLLIEPLSYPTMLPITRHFGLRLRPLQADAEGILPDSIEQLARRGDARLVYLVPTLHNPTTVTLSTERRQAVASLARRYRLSIIEDDVFRLLAADPPPTIRSLAPDNAHYITSLSKTLAPGFRLAFTVPPKGGTEAMNRQQMVIGGRPNALAAEAARRWIETGVADRVLASIKSELAQRRAIALDALSGLEVACAPGAMFAWTALPRHWHPAEFAAAAQAIGIKVTPGSAFAMDPHADHHGFRAGLGPAASHEALRQGFERLRTLVEARRTDELQTMA